MGNAKWMAVHLVLLTIILGSYIKITWSENTIAINKIYVAIDTFVYLLMAFILDQLNTQCAALATVDENTSHNRSSINIIEPADLSDLSEEDSEQEIISVEVKSII
jgi:hypothetical protein